MRILSIRKLTLALAAFSVGAAMLAAPTQAHATMQLSWSAGTALLGTDATNTSFGFSIPVAVNGFKISGTALGTNSGAFASGTAGMDLSTVSISSAGPATLILYLTQNDLDDPLGQGSLHGELSGHFLAGGTGSFSMVSYGNDTNLLYGNALGQAGTTPLISGLTDVKTSTINPGGSASTTFVATSKYSITQILTINFTTGGIVSLSSDGSTTFATPEPGTIAMAFTALPVLGLVWMRRRKQQA